MNLPASASTSTSASASASDAHRFLYRTVVIVAVALFLPAPTFAFSVLPKPAGVSIPFSSYSSIIQLKSHLGRRSNPTSSPSSQWKTVTLNAVESSDVSQNSVKRIYLACDGFGEDLKNAMKTHIQSKHNFIVEDLGCDTYYDAAAKVSSKVGKSSEDMGLLVCGTGMGVGIVANKFPGVRAATVEHVTAARFARAVNDANVICLGQLMTQPQDAKEMVDAFLGQDFNDHPVGDDGKPATWWNEDVENFLSTSKEGIEAVEEQAQGGL